MISKGLGTINGLSHIWQIDQIRENILVRLDVCSLRALRLTASNYLEVTSQRLFKQARVVFTTRSLTRPARREALSRIGHFIEHFTFVIMHSKKDFLPPLVNPETGNEIKFVYTPNTTMKSKSHRSKYASQELEDILIQQYPPIFHAATNIPAFVNLLSLIPNLQALRILCQGKFLGHNSRKNIIDYVLISLRIALERAPLYRLKKLSLCHIHPAGIRYLRHTIGYGCTPSASRRWKQIEQLEITMDTWDFHGDKSSYDHLRILNDFIRSFSPNLKKMKFIWNGQNGPCPFFANEGSHLGYLNVQPKLFRETTSTMSPLPALPSRLNMTFPKLKYFQLSNMKMTKIEVASLILQHQKTVHEFQFHNVHLADGSDWEEALMPLNLVDESNTWLLFQSGHKKNRNADFSINSQHPLSDIKFDEVVETIYPILDKIEIHKKSKIVKSSVINGEPIYRKRRRKVDRREKEKQVQPMKTKNSTLSQSNDYCQTLDPDFQGVQRNIQLENRQMELSFDPKKRISTLKKAKQAVLKQLGREFCRDSKSGRFCQENLNDEVLSSKSGMRYIGQESLTALVPLIVCR